MKNDLVYLFSSFIDNPEFFFQGYCFVDADYIFGLEGAEKYHRITGKRIGSGEDGCYITANKEYENYIFGSDHSGFKKIFYYKNPITKNWVVSNSINLMVEHLSEHGIRVSPNYEQLVFMAAKGSFAQQLVSFNTIAAEIMLLPINTSLKIGKECLEINRNASEISLEKSYEELLYNFVEIWVSRFKTLLSNDKLFISQSITGGVDSRAVFALSHLARQEVKVYADYKLICTLTRGDPIDIDIAQKICSHYDYELNNKDNHTVNKKVKLTNLQKYEVWKDTSLGIYRPIYFPNKGINAFNITIGGGGGENHRPFYGKNIKASADDRFDLFIDRFCQNIDYNYLNNCEKDNLNNLLKQDMDMTIEHLSQQPENQHLDKLVIHYRHFRNRLHAGLFPQYRSAITPLSSKLLDCIANEENIDKLENSQILYDLINLVEGLLDFSFDRQDKEPTANNLKDLVKIKKDMKYVEGKSYIGNVDNTSFPQEKEQGGSNPLFYLNKDFEAACESSFVKSVWSEEFIESAQEIMTKALLAGRLTHATDGMEISTIISTAMINK